MSERNKMFVLYSFFLQVFSRHCHILGVAQLLNKNNGKPFTESDESLFEVKKIISNVLRNWG